MPVSLLNVDQHLLVALTLSIVQLVAALLHVAQVVLYVVRPGLSVETILPDGLQLLLQQDLFVQLYLLQCALQPIDLLALNDADAIHGSCQWLHGPGAGSLLLIAATYSVRLLICHIGIVIISFGLRLLFFALLLAFALV